MQRFTDRLHADTPPLAPPLLPADRLRTCPASDRPRVFREVYDHVLRTILREHQQRGRTLTLGANGKIARFIRGTIGADRRVLEIGCGFGITAMEVARGQRELVGVDASSVGIDNATALARASSARLRYEVMDATDLRFPAGRFDAAYSIDLVEHLHPDDLARHLAEVRRVLQPGGTYVVKTPGELTGPHEGDHPGDQGFLHFREYRYGTLLPELRRAGFRRFASPAFSMRISCRLPGPPRFPAAWNLPAESVAGMAPARSRLRRRLARWLGVKQVVVAARRD